MSSVLPFPLDNQAKSSDASKTSLLSAVELFAGAGGLALGVESSGFFHAAVVERDPAACKTIRENAKRGVIANWPLVEGDVRSLHYGDLAHDLDLLSAGPPCQPFSLAGKQRGRSDSRDMFPETIRAVRELRPKAFLIENVKNLESISSGNYMEYIRLQLQYPEIERKVGEKWSTHLARLERTHTNGKENIGYRLVTHTLNAADYGIPQKRDRVFMVGVRSDLGMAFSFPEPTHSVQALISAKWKTNTYWDSVGVAKKNRPQIPPRIFGKIDEIAAMPESTRKPWVTVRQALIGLPEPKADFTEIENHEYLDGARVYEGHTGSPLDEPAKTIKAGSHGVPGGENMLVKDNGAVRYFTMRECARLQTFPDKYFFTGSWGMMVRQLGNAVPVSLAKIVSGAVADAIKGHYKMEMGKNVGSRNYN